jgi:hypothetical protein
MTVVAGFADHELLPTEYTPSIFFPPGIKSVE